MSGVVKWLSLLTLNQASEVRVLALETFVKLCKVASCLTFLCYQRFFFFIFHISNYSPTLFDGQIFDSFFCGEVLGFNDNDEHLR